MGAESTHSPAALEASVVVRSYNRLGACVELVRALLAQNFESFEVIVVEQSTQKSEADAAALAELSRADSRLRIFERPPLGPPRARNEGCRHARGEILLFIDDDDLPLSRDWIALHLENYTDPSIVGVSGGDVLSPDESLAVCPYKNYRRARRRNISYSALGVPYCYPRLRERIEPVGWLRGGNSSVRRSVVEEIGGWDEDVVDHEEHSFCFKLERVLGSRRLVFDPRPVILRRNDLGGGLARRQADSFATYQRWFVYFHRIYARYHWGRMMLAYPLYPLVCFWLTASWIWESSRRAPSKRAKLIEIGRTWALSPIWFLACVRRLSSSARTPDPRPR